MLPQASDDHWLLLSLGLVAMFARLGFSFVCAAFIVLGPTATAQGSGVSGVNEVGPVVAIFALAIALNILQVFIHEMGHAVAAWSVGRRVHMICVGILGYAPGLGKFMRIQIPADAEYAGYVQVSPIWPDLSPGKSIWISAGGPLATGALGVLIWGGAGLVGPASDPLASVESMRSIPLAALWLGGFFVLDALVNLIPLRWTLGGASDGLHILGYLGGSGWTADNWAETRLATAELSPELVSDAEWEHLKPLVGAPFNSKVFDLLLEKIVAQRAD
jgi:hypothetical protein